jgi:glucosyl-dolichyl phosphate glucuronosyltransferase
MIYLTLDSFLKQSYPKELYEIIVCDNNSSDSTKEVVEKYVDENPNIVKYMYEKRQGVHYARNSAAKESTADLLYFTDDDMIADVDLLVEIIKVFKLDPKVATVTGRVLPKFEVPPPKWVTELCNNALLSLNDPKEELIISKDDCNVFSCHQAIKRNIFLEAGGYNPENTAGEWIGDGETGLNIKIKKLGFKFGYNGDSVIHHIIPQKRMTQSYLNGRLANQGNCDSYTLYREKRFTNPNLFWQILKNCIYYFVALSITFVMFVTGRNKWRVLFARSFYYIRRVKYDLRLIYSIDWRNFVLKDDWLLE